MGTRISFRYKNENKPETLDTYTKAIRFWEGGFCLAVYEPESRNVALMEEHLFEEDYPLNGKMHLLAETEAAWETGGGTRFICFNRPNTQIPEKLFNEADKKLYLELLTDNPYRFTPIEEPVAPFALYTLSGWDNNLYHEILSLHPDCRLQSGMSLLLQLLARQEGKRKMAAFVENGHLDVAAAERTALLGANSSRSRTATTSSTALPDSHTRFSAAPRRYSFIWAEKSRRVPCFSPPPENIFPPCISWTAVSPSSNRSSTGTATCFFRKHSHADHQREPSGKENQCAGGAAGPAHHRHGHGEPVDHPEQLFLL